MLLSIPDAAKALSVSENTVRRRRAKGLLTGTQVAGKWLIEVENGAESGRFDSAPEDNALVEQLRAEISHLKTVIDKFQLTDHVNALNAATESPPGAIRRIWKRLF